MVLDPSAWSAEGKPCRCPWREMPWWSWMNEKAVLPVLVLITDVTVGKKYSQLLERRREAITFDLPPVVTSCWSHFLSS